MRIAVFSDTHGYNKNMKEVLETCGPFDAVIHLGDVGNTMQEIRRMTEGIPFYAVCGNNDFEPLPEELTVDLGTYHTLLTHGHYYGVYRSPDRLFSAARQRGFHLVMYGHIHRPLVERREGITVINPGSISYPRQEGGKPTWILMDIDSKGIAHFHVNELDPKKAGKFSFF